MSSMDHPLNANLFPMSKRSKLNTSDQVPASPAATMLGVKRGPGRPKKVQDINHSHAVMRRKPGRSRKGAPIAKAVNPINKLGRNLYRLLPLAKIATTQYTYLIPIPQPSVKTLKLLTQVSSPDKDNITVLHTVKNHPIKGYHLKPLFEHTQQLWDITFLAYLQLLENKSPKTIKVHDFYVIDRLGQKDYSCVHRLYRTKKATDFTWTFFPTIKNRHFYLLVAHIDQTGEVKISSYDSMHLLHSSELQAVRQYYQDAISLETSGRSYTYVLEENAAEKIIVQQDSSSCE